MTYKRASVSEGSLAKRRRFSRLPRYGRYSTFESKFLNTSLLGSSGASFDFRVNNPVEGTGSNERNGRKIRSYSYEYQLRQVVPSGTISYIRVIVYVPKQANFAMLLANLGSAVDNSRYWVLHDKLYSGGNVSAAGSPIIACQARIRQAITSEFDDGGSQVKGQVRLYVIANGTTSIDGFAKCWYKDF